MLRLDVLKNYAKQTSVSYGCWKKACRTSRERIYISSIQKDNEYQYRYICIWQRKYKRIRRRGLKLVIFELAVICCGFNLHKYHLKNQKALAAA